MTAQRDQVTQKPVEILAQSAAFWNNAEQVILSVTYQVLCEKAGLPTSTNPRVAWKLHRSGVLKKASIDHREYRKCRIDFAWPEKRVGLRVTTWPRCRTRGSVIPEFVYADAFLRDQGWLIFHVDPASKTFDEQLHRAIAQIKRASGSTPGGHRDQTINPPWTRWAPVAMLGPDIDQSARDALDDVGLVTAGSTGSDRTFDQRRRCGW